MTENSKSNSKQAKEHKSNSKSKENKSNSKSSKEDEAQKEYLDDFFQMRRLADKASANSDPTSIYLIALGALFVFLLLAGAVWVITDNMKNSILSSDYSKTTGTDRLNKSLSFVEGDNLSFRLDGTKYMRQFKGSANAKVTLIEFSEFQCPFCIRVQPTITQLLKDYDGEINLVHMNFIVHPTAHLASEAVECAGEQDKYFKMHDIIFDEKKTDEAGLKELATKIGLDMGKYNSCISSGKMKSVVDAQTNLGRTYDVRGTPSFLIGKIKNGQFYGQLLVGAQPIRNFKSVIDEMLVN